MTTYLYARVSTDKQETENQTLILKAQHPDGILIEEEGSGIKERPKLKALIATLMPGDRLVVNSLDRLGRNCGELCMLVDKLTQNGIVIVSVREGIDFGTMMGRMAAHILAAVADFERAMIVARTKEAMGRAKSRGVRLGRKTTVDVVRVNELADRGYGIREIARELNVSPSQVSRVLSKKSA